MIERMTKERGALSACLCGCGELVAGSWKLGHAARGIDGYRAGPAPLPPPGPDGPDDLEGLDDLDSMDPVEYQALVDAHGPPGGSADYGPGFMPGDIPGPGPAPGPLPADPPPARIKAVGGRSGQAKKVTAAVRSDIEGKLGIALHMGGTVWAARDPVCGGAYLAQLPAIRPAMTELIIMSPDLVQWFTGVGGGFMLWFQLAAACWPVLATIWAHHGPGAAESFPADAQQPQQAFAA